MYKVWSLIDVKNYIHKLEEKSGFYLEDDVQIKITQAQSYIGQCHLIRNNNIWIVESISFTKYLLDGNVDSKEVKDIIAHEFCHAWAEHGLTVDERHTLKQQFKNFAHEFKSFKDKCAFLNCSPSPTVSPKVHQQLLISKQGDYKTKNKYKVYCTGCGANWIETKDLTCEEYVSNYVCRKCKSKIKISEFYLTEKEDKFKMIKGYIIRRFKAYDFKNCSNTSFGRLISPNVREVSKWRINGKYDITNSTFTYNMKLKREYASIDDYTLEIINKTKEDISTVLKKIDFIEGFDINVDNKNNLKLIVYIRDINKINFKVI